MRHIRVVRWAFERPVHGWLPVMLELDDYVLRAAGSWVINDPLYELVEAGAFLARGEVGTRRAFLFLEPAGYVVDLENVDGTTVHVRVGTRGGFRGVPRADHPLRIEIECTVDHWTMARAIREAVDGLFTEVGTEHALAGWRDPTPYREPLATLRRLTRERRRR
jgi:hypothetical protein